MDAMSEVSQPNPEKTESSGVGAHVWFDSLTNTYVKLENGKKSEYNARFNKWIPLPSEEEIRTQTSHNIVPGVDENEPAQPSKKKRKQDEEAGTSKSQKKARSNVDKPNTAVYVSGLPLDASDDDINEVFKKAGSLLTTYFKGKDEPRIHRYKDGSGNFKGEVLVVYYKVESVGLALELLDGRDFRPGQPMRVELPNSVPKSQRDGGAQQQGDRTQEQRRNIERRKKLDRKINDWGDEEPSALPKKPSRHDKIVILKNVFTFEELKTKSVELIGEEIKTTFGQDTSIEIFDQEEDGVVKIRFVDAPSAQKCVDDWDGQPYKNNRRIEAYIFDGREKFKKSKKKDEDEEQDDAEERRLDAFGNSIEEQDETLKEATE